ncbi:class I SAM-dependent methyltransferase [Polynucleobacter paneuropaeus]|nr:class I SAM-dependent methyltransferase [Polynucleobacter paneuropaeus]MBT8541010.1 class I SAM-dependent methyltransferase [Polynucleobacter paneuropaeus]MBT8555579.1 class I SAM-dependent methyltransferase [Polynucleobacter paneuropaeus]MBT8560855.1 class I SAM-dependent methyltransferase [Polynucleobacter paneuropaeus]
MNDINNKIEYIDSDNMESMYSSWYSGRGTGGFHDVQEKWLKLCAVYKAKNIASQFAPSSSSKILDVGGGTGEVSEALYNCHQFPKIDLIDISSDAIDFAAGKEFINTAKVFNGYAIDVPDKYYDLVFASHVLEHVPDQRKFLSELKRVAKNIFIEVPIDYSKNINTELLLSYGHVNVYTPSIVKFYIESEGMVVKKYFGTNWPRKYSIKFYNNYYNFNKKNILDLIEFNLRFIISRVFNSINPYKLPSNFCLYCSENYQFKIVNLFEIQKNEYKNHLLESN